MNATLYNRIQLQKVDIVFSIPARRFLVRSVKRLATAILLGLLWPVGASAATEAVQSYVAVSTRYQALLKEYAAIGSEPSLERVSPLLAQLTDYEVVVAARGAEDPLKSLNSVCGAANAVNVSISLFGLENSGLKSKEPAEAVTLVRAMAERNTLRFQHQIMPLMSFLTTCFAVQLPYMSAFVQSLSATQLTSDRLAGLNQARSGMEEFLAGSLVSAAEPRIQEKLRFSLLETLALRAPIYAESLPPDRRNAIRRAGELALQRVPVHFRLNIRRVIDAMNTDKCNALCAM